MVRCHPRIPDDYTTTSDGRTASLEWIIKTDTKLNPSEVAALPETPAVGDLYPYDRALVCQSVTFRCNGSAFDWIASAQYGPRTLPDYSREKRPWNQPPEIRNSVEYQTEICTNEYVPPYWKAIYGGVGLFKKVKDETKRLTNQFGRLFDPAPTRRIAVEVKQMTWYVRKWEDYWSVQIRDTVNLNQIWLDGLQYAEQVVWLTDLVVNPYYYNEQNTNAVCWKIDATFRYRPGGWLFRPMLAGYQARAVYDDSVWHNIFEKNGYFYLEDEDDVRGMQPVASPVPLDADGTLLFESREEMRSKYEKIIYESHQLIRPVDWTALSIPTVKAVRRAD